MRHARTVISNGEREWDVEREIGVELYLQAGQVYLLASDKALPDGLQRWVNQPDECYELVLRFRSQGYYQPMSMYGGSDHLGWPEEGDDERTLVWAKLIVGCGAGEQRIPIDDELAEQLFEALSDTVYDADLSSDY